MECGVLLSRPVRQPTKVRHALSATEGPPKTPRGTEPHQPIPVPFQAHRLSTPEPRGWFVPCSR